MTYKSIGKDIETIRNQIQDNTTNPYAASTDFSHTSKYVFAFLKKPASGTPTDQELYDKANRERTLPIIVDIELIDEGLLPMRGGKWSQMPVLIRCFCKADTKLTFQSNRMEAEELALDKLNEIRYNFQTNNTIKAAFAAAGMYVSYDGYGSLRPIDPGNTTDFGYAMEVTFTRSTRT